MNELRRHAPTSRPRRRGSISEPRGIPHLYAARKRRPVPDLYIADRAEGRRGGFRWFFSTCLAAAVGAIAIGAVILGSLDGSDKHAPQMRREPRINVAQPQVPIDGLKWATPKSDRLQTSAGAMATKYVVQESVKVMRSQREYMAQKFYARVALKLAAVPANKATAIPPFNPFLLYGSTDGNNAEREARGASEVSVKVVDLALLGSILPAEDGQEIDTQEVTDIVDRSASSEAAIRATIAPEGADLTPGRPEPRTRQQVELAPNTTVLEKSSSDADDIEEDADEQRVRMKLGRGETLGRLLTRMGADAWHSREFVEKARTLLPEAAITTAYEIEFALVPSLTDPSKTEPNRIAIYDEAGVHKVTVGRTASGDIVASATPTASPQPIARKPAGEPDQQTPTSLYASLYHSALTQGISPEVIMQVLRVHAYETDFRRRARGSDTVDLFFDLRDEGKAADNPPSDLLATAVTVGGETQRYFRFRTPDGIVDFYDENGNNSRKFLMRRPIRSEEVRFVSGYGMRRHPLLGVVKMHTGVDWGGALGTPILASGSGVIEEAGFKGQNGNYIRIRHANGYQTAYSHLQSRFPPDIREGAKVRQGQVIGYLGNTGLSTGPHLHYEVLVGNRFVDPMSIQVPKEKKLAGKQLADFQRERARIEDLMRRPPVRVAQLEAR